MLALVMPTLTGRKATYEKCLAAYVRHSRDFPGGVVVHVEIDKATCGEAWDIGAHEVLRCRPEITHLHFAADDIEPMPGWWEPMKEAADMGRVATSVVLNTDLSLQSAGMTNGQPHLRIPDDWSVVEHTLTPFVTREQLEKVLPIPHDLHFCTDWWVDARLGQTNRVVVRTASQLVHHNHPFGRGAGMEIHARNRHDRALYERYLRETP